MASSPVASISRQEATSLMRQVQGNQLFNRQLSSVCQVNGLKSTGVKADLQRRIIDLIQETINANDISRFQQVRQSIANASAQRGSPAKGGLGRGYHPTAFPMPNNMTPSLQSYTTAHTDYHTGTATTHSGHRPGGSYGNILLTFRPSPFYHVESPVGAMRSCEVMTQHRNSVVIPIKLNDHPTLQQCITDKSYRIMVFCANDTAGVQHISFPHQSELRVNGGDIKANLRGLKNKPGSTRPVDITSSLRLRHNYVNNVEFTYALTTKKFYLTVNLCKVTPVSELASTISTRRRIPKDSVVMELNKKALDPDVVATSQVLSLRCPLSYMRLEVPCRSLSCTHIQCFDATSYLQLQEQGPQWLCPICSKLAPFEQLAVDEFVKDILDSTPTDLEAVTIEPNGRWFVKQSRDEAPLPPNSASLEDDDDFEISEINIVGGHHLETPNRVTSGTGTPASGGRDSAPSITRGTASNSAKRPAPAVIDLTISSDDEEHIPRPRKRQHIESNGFLRESSGLGFLSDSPTGYAL